MKRLALALAACMMLGQFAVADDPASGGSPTSTGALPLQVPASARNAAEAPRWDAPPSNAGDTSVLQSGSSGGSTPAAFPGAGSNSNLQNSASATNGAQFGASNHTAQPVGSITSDTDGVGSNLATFPSDAAAPDLQPKPLQSVMKRRPGETPVAGGVLPAAYNGTQVMSGTSPTPGAAVPGTSNSAGGWPSSPQAAATGGNPPGFFPGAQAAGISPAVAPTSVANTNRTLPGTPAASATAPANRPNVVDPEKLAAAKAAGDLLASSIDNGTAGTTPLRLIDVLNQTSEAERSAAVREYWNLARAWSDYRWAVDEAKRLEVVVPARGAVDAPMLSTSRASATARMNDAQLNVESAQAALMRTARLAPQTGTYFPTDAPLVGPYQTYFSVLFAGRPSPGRTWQIDRALPLRLKTINDRTAAVQSATSAVHYAEESHARGEVDMRTVLACHDELHQQRRDFLNAVNDYNVDIAEYAATVAGSAAPDRLVAMLIHVKPAERVSAVPGRPGGTIQLPAPPTGAASAVGSPNSRNSPNGRSTATSNDGWVPSTSRGADATTPPSGQSPAGSPLPGSMSGQVDPFTPQR